jgi:hypothetical protein
MTLHLPSPLRATARRVDRTTGVWGTAIGIGATMKELQ